MQAVTGAAMDSVLDFLIPDLLNPPPYRLWMLAIVGVFYALKAAGEGLLRAEPPTENAILAVRGQTRPSTGAARHRAGMAHLVKSFTCSSPRRITALAGSSSSLRPFPPDCGGTGRPTIPGGPVRGIVLVSLIVSATAVPAAGQMAIAVRAGMGSAWMASPGGVSFEPCLPDRDCPSPADEAVRGLTFGADLDIPVSGSSDVLGLRIGAAYARKGGAGSGHDAGGQPDSGSLSTSYLQLSLLLRARAFLTSHRRHSVAVLVGPWVGGRLSCRTEGSVELECQAVDAGIAVAAGVEIALPRSSRASVALEGIYLRGVREFSGGYLEMTRLAAMQVGFVYRID